MAFDNDVMAVRRGGYLGGGGKVNVNEHFLSRRGVHESSRPLSLFRFFVRFCKTGSVVISIPFGAQPYINAFSH